MRARCFRPDLLLAMLLLFCGAAARAEDVIYGPDGAPTVVQHKLYPMSSKWEASFLFNTALNNALVAQWGLLFGLSYHTNEWLDFGAEGLFNLTGLSNLSDNVRANMRARVPATNGCTAEPYAGCKDEFANDNQLRIGAFGVARLSPFYGKFNLASEVKVHFQLFALGGAGVAMIHRESVNLCADPGTTVCGHDAAGNPLNDGRTHFQTSDLTTVAGLVGGGFRFYFNQRLSLMAEVRGYLFSSSYKEHNDLTVPSSGTPKSYLALISTFDAGLSFLF